MLKIKIDDKLLNSVLNRIKNHAALGYSHYVYTYNTCRITPRMVNSLKYILQQRGFYVKQWDGFYGMERYIYHGSPVVSCDIVH